MSIRNFGVFGLAVAVSLAACTGNGPTPTDDTGGGGGGTPTAVVTSVALVPSSTSLPANADGTSGGAPGITLTAIALDASNNVVANAPLTFKVCAPDTALSDTDCNDVLSTRGGAPAAVISAPGSVTGSDGTLSATMTTGGNAELGVLNVIASSGSIDSSILKISVVSATAGTSTNSATADFLTVTASSKRLPNDASTAAQGVVINAFVTDAARNAIAGVPVSFSATSGQLIITDNKSDATGKVSAILTTGGDSTSRCIAVTVTAPQTSNATALSNNLPTGTTSELLCPSSGTQTGIQVVAISSGSPVANTLTLLTSSPQLSSSAAQTTNGVTLTAIVRDANNNVLPGVVVTFSTPNSGAITVTQAVTDSNGQALAVLTTGGDQQNRSITVTAGTGAVSDNVTINVVGTTLAISGPTTVQSGVSTTYTAILLNSSGSPISNKVVQFSYSGTGTFSPVNGQATTNSSGQATVTLTASVSGTLSASALSGTATASQDITASTDCFVFTSPTTNQQVNIGSNATITIHWTTGGCGGAVVADGTTVNFSTTRGTLSALTDTTTGGDATVTVSSAQAGFATLIASSNSGSSPVVTRTIEFVATTPGSVSVQASPATIGTNQQSTITATVLDATNNLVKNALVQFTLTDTTGGTLSAGQATTNSQGRAQVTYSATSTPSSSGGVSIKGTVVSVNGTGVTPVNGTTTLT
ncbi:MAG TPA: Ig-like domain-containing protein, partial [Candidatus Binatia bacterium]|nr:Ig-like domain-containing protein [Candidatus Binatia bacterium]